MAHATCSWRLPHSAAAALRSRSPAAPAEELSRSIAECEGQVLRMRVSPRTTSACAYLRTNCAVRQPPYIHIPVTLLHAAPGWHATPTHTSASRRTSRCCVLPCGGLGLQAAQLQQLVQAVHGLARSAKPLRHFCSHPAQRKGHARAPACALLYQLRSKSWFECRNNENSSP